jgi:AraC-like DNA-binding protein
MVNGGQKPARSDSSAIIFGPRALDMAVSILLIRTLVDAVERAGVDRARLLDGTRFDAGLLADTSGRAAVEQYDMLVERALDLTKDAAFGLHLGEMLNAQSHNLTGLLVGNAATLRDGIDVLVRFHQLLVDRPTWRLIEDERRAALVFAVGTASARVLRFRAETAMTGILRMVRFFAPAARPERLTFEHAAPSYAAEYARVFDGVGEIAFEADATRLSFDRALLDASQLHHDPAFQASFEAQAKWRVAQLTEQLSYADRVRQALLEPTAIPGRDMKAVARAVGLSVRSLRRRLRQEGTSFADLADDTRATRAKLLLAEDGRAIEQAAYELGFSDPRAFQRAFKRWTGTTPSEFRRARNA